MELKMDLGQPVRETLGSLEPSRLLAVGRATDGDGPLVVPGWRPYSFQAECECPEDCLRDHENE